MKYVFLSLFLFSSSWSFAQDFSDCLGAIPVCENEDLQYSPTGIGTNDFQNPNNIAPSCGFSESASVWIKFKAASTGYIDFVISPNNGTDDYDFAIYGPNVSCDNLGASIRCSSTNPQAAGVSADTGLSATETETSEGPGVAGNGFVKHLQVTQGDVYYLLIDNFDQQQGFTLNFGSIDDTDLDCDITCDYKNDYEISVCQSDLVLENYDTNIINAQTDINQVEITYFNSLANAQNNVNPISDYTMNNSGTYEFYARITDQEFCFDFSKLTINYDKINANSYAYKICEEDQNKIEEFDLQAINTTINDQNYPVKYYLNEQDANQENNPLPNLYTNITSPQIIYARVNGAVLGCFKTSPVSLEVYSNPEVSNYDFSLCDDNQDGIEAFDLTSIYGNITQESSVNISFYLTENQANSASGGISNTYYNTQQNQVIYARIQNQSGCYSLSEITLITLETPDKTEEEILICSEGTTSISVGSNYQSYLWNTGETTDSITVGVGEYSVRVENDLGCFATKKIKVSASSPPFISDITIGNTTFTFQINGTGTYQYSIDGINYQPEPTFNGANFSNYKLWVKDMQNCIYELSYTATVGIPNVFTPNGDGYNDFWEIKSIKFLPNVNIEIFDRYGKLLKSSSLGSFKWDGMYNGKPLPDDDYWYIIKIGGTENKSYTGSVSILRKIKRS